MTIEDILNDARSVVKKVVPDHVEITQVDFEGPTIVIYTKNMDPSLRPRRTPRRLFAR